MSPTPENDPRKRALQALAEQNYQLTPTEKQALVTARNAFLSCYVSGLAAGIGASWYYVYRMQAKRFAAARGARVFTLFVGALAGEFVGRSFGQSRAAGLLQMQLPPQSPIRAAMNARDGAEGLIFRDHDLAPADPSAAAMGADAPDMAASSDRGLARPSATGRRAFSPEQQQIVDRWEQLRQQGGPIEGTDDDGSDASARGVEGERLVSDSDAAWASSNPTAIAPSASATRASAATSVAASRGNGHSTRTALPGIAVAGETDATELPRTREDFEAGLRQGLLRTNKYGDVVDVDTR
ncbi:hypothetical protein CXG81DRAFT_28206 [Caulochytrium protostelioides]|uniref:Uncharacterized protein n=1 Tax=Caulochytrium protostelioides TaxID=1555241 RepID=A0A4P9WZP9_9FUNG|nr:hypothetical protein CXG81DRAFT_28206 [Caulochytrium protostelioides]|eukprot:RKO99014.1 hypothetical protein CXG81DRAFT_28206 [Caulochytrium protostelioides]